MGRLKTRIWNTYTDFYIGFDDLEVHISNSPLADFHYGVGQKQRNAGYRTKKQRLKKKK